MKLLDRASATHHSASHVNEIPANAIESSLPLDDPDFREIVEIFLERLDAKVVQMHEAFSSRDFDDLSDLAHWLRGSSATAGIDAFWRPAERLEIGADAHDESVCRCELATIDELSQRVQLRPISAT